MKLELEEELKQRNKELLILNTVISYLNQFLNIGELLEGALEKVLEIMAIESGALLLLNDDKSSFVLEISKGIFAGFCCEKSLLLMPMKAQSERHCVQVITSFYGKAMIHGFLRASYCGMRS